MAKKVIEQPPVPTAAENLTSALDVIRKKHGEGSVRLYGSVVVERPRVVIPSGSMRLDAILGCAGYPRGRIIEVFGQESSGKTTLALHAVAECQRMGLAAAYVDIEHALDPVYAKNLGVNLDDMVFSQPDTAEEALQIIEELCNSRMVAMIVLDSVAALVPKAELDGETGDSHMGLQARLMSQHLRKLAGAAGRSDTLVIFLNQMRQKIGIVYGNPNVTTGGNALKFYASTRITIKRGEKLMVASGKESKQVGSTHEIQTVKNKVAPPFQTAEVDIIWGRGIDRFSDLRDTAVAERVIRQESGGRYYFGEQFLCQGQFKLRELLEESVAWRSEITGALEKLGFRWTG